jgi:hypothetical protein
MFGGTGTLLGYRMFCKAKVERKFVASNFLVRRKQKNTLKVKGDFQARPGHKGQEEVDLSSTLSCISVLVEFAW